MILSVLSECFVLVGSQQYSRCFPHIDFTWVGRPGIVTAAEVFEKVRESEKESYSERMNVMERTDSWDRVINQRNVTVGRKLGDRNEIRETPMKIRRVGKYELTAANFSGLLCLLPYDSMQRRINSSAHAGHLQAVDSSHISRIWATFGLPPLKLNNQHVIPCF